MKKALLALASVLVAVATYGQGISLYNDNPITRKDNNNPVGGTDVNVQLFYSGAGGEIALTPATTFFADPSFAGFIIPVDVTVPGAGAGGLDPGQTGNFVLRAFQGSSFAVASATPGALSGQVTFSQKIGGGLLPPEAMNQAAFTGFQLTPTVPEPSTIALGAIGAAALLFRRRK